MALNIRLFTPADPELHFDVAQLPNPFNFALPICLTNNERFTVYVRALLVNPPADWVVSSVDLGGVASGASTCLTAVFQRNIPTLTNGEYVESLTLRVEFYKDSTYTQLYTGINIPITVNFFDSTDPAWTVLATDNFDDGTTQGWAQVIYTADAGCQLAGFVGPDSTFYVSPFYSLRLDTSGFLNRAAEKTYNVPAATKAYLVLHVKTNNASARFAVNINDTVVKRCHTPIPQNVWNRFSFPLTPGQSNVVRIGVGPSGLTASLYFDDIKIIYK